MREQGRRGSTFSFTLLLDSAARGAVADAAPAKLAENRSARLDDGFAAAMQFYAFPREHWHRIPSDNARAAPRRDQAQDARRERIPGPRERAPARHRRRASSHRDREQTPRASEATCTGGAGPEVMSLFLRCNPRSVPRSTPALCRSRELRWGRRSEAQLSRDERKGRDSPRCESRRRFVVRRSGARTRTGALQSLREDHLLGRSHCAVPK